ncbi:unnamed protein product [Brassica oleracea]
MNKQVGKAVADKKILDRWCTYLLRIVLLTDKPIVNQVFVYRSIVMLVVDQDEGPREDEESDTHNVSAVCFQPELPIILTGFEDGTVGIWHATTYESFI